MWSRVFVVWITLAVVMILNGILRVPVLVPAFGTVVAEVVSAVIACSLILSVSYLFLRRLGPLSLRRLSAISATWVSLTVVFEFIFGHYVEGRPWYELVQNYNVAEGHLWPLVLLTLAAAPFLSNVIPRIRALCAGYRAS